MRLFNDIQAAFPEETHDCTREVKQVLLNYLRKRDEESGLLNLFDTWQLFPDGIVDNNMYVQEEIANYGHNRFDGKKHVLACLVKKDNEEQFLDHSAKIYYTGRIFPPSISINDLYYFMPYIKGKGVRDLYLMKKVRVGTRKEGQPDEDKEDFRIVFDIEFIGSLFDDFKPIKLDIARTFKSTTIAKVRRKS